MKVAAYCRVSTDQADQVNSFESQKRYFRAYIEGHPDWELSAVYADEGVTGTSTGKRKAFNRMIEDAKRRAFDYILTKEVSRFSRNILDTIAYTRQLRHLGIGVLFMNDGIDTLDPDAELRLSIMGSLAQEESRKTSSRVKWGQTRRMEQGVVFGCSLLGYDVKDGTMTVNPEGAKLVRLIYQKYVQERKSTSVIARELEDAGYRTLTGKSRWSSTALRKILQNEKYCGDLKQKKTYTPDYLTHQKKYNHGEEAFVFLKDHHEPIVSRSLWEEAQRELSRRSLHGGKKAGSGSRYPLSGKIRCGACGACFVSRQRKRRDGSFYRIWRCGTSVLYGSRQPDPTDRRGDCDACGTDGDIRERGCSTGYQLRDEVGIDLIRRSAAMVLTDREEIASGLTELLWRACLASERDIRERIKRQERERLKIREKKKAVMDAYFSGEISLEEMKFMKEEYDRQLDGLAGEGDIEPGPENESASREALGEQVRALLSGGKSPDILYSSLLEEITAWPDRRLEVRLKGLPVTWVYQLED